MARKKISNRAQVEKILQSAQKAIAKAEKSGKTVPEYIKKMASTPIKTRYSKREVEGFKYHLDPRHIAAEARKTRILSFSTNDGGTHELVVHATDKEFPRKLGKEVYSGIKYALEHHPSRDFDIELRKFLSFLDYNVKLIKWRSINPNNFIINTFKEIKMDDFVRKFLEKYDAVITESVITAMNSTSIVEELNKTETSTVKETIETAVETSYFYAGVEALVGSGRFSEKEYEKYIDFSKEKAMASFADNLNITPERAQTLYDFFQKSSVWATYRKDFKPSDDKVMNDLLDYIESGLNSGMSISAIDNIIDTNKVKSDTLLVRRALENAIQNATKSN